jgi:hypothetical protein
MTRESHSASTFVSTFDALNLLLLFVSCVLFISVLFHIIYMFRNPNKRMLLSGQVSTACAMTLNVMFKKTPSLVKYCTAC